MRQTTLSADAAGEVRFLSHGRSIQFTNQAKGLLPGD